jgi:hypothetical protein
VEEIISMARTKSIKASAAGLALFAVLALLAVPAVAQDLFHRAENQVQVALVKVVRQAQATEIHLQTLGALKSVCWESTGRNSPYLLVDGRRYRYLGSRNITPCPTRRPYADREIMVLRFEPIPATANTFSLVEGQGGENQMIDPSSSKDRYWNFLRVKLK